MVADFKVLSIAQSTPWPCALNTITVSISANIPLALATMRCEPFITISGLKGACLVTSSVELTNIPAASDGQSAFSTVSNYSTGGNGNLAVKPVQDMDANAVRVFSFKINNPVDSQPAPLFQITSTGIPICVKTMKRDCDYEYLRDPTLNRTQIAQRNDDYGPIQLNCSAKATVLPAANSQIACIKLADTAVFGSTRGAIFESHPRDAEPLLVHAPAFITRKIGQNSSYPGDVNRITVTIRSNIDIPRGSLVTFMAFNNSCALTGPKKLHSNTFDDSDLRYHSGSHVRFFGSHVNDEAGGQGMWDDIEKMLKLYVVEDIDAGKFITFAFDVNNPKCGQPAQGVCIRAKSFCSGESCRRKDMLIPRRLMEHDTSVLPTACSPPFSQFVTSQQSTQQASKAPLMVLQPLILLANLSHTSAWACAMNTLTLVFRTNVPLYTKMSPTVTIDLSTSHGSQTPAGQLDVTFAGLSVQADWNPVTGQLVFLLPIDTDPCTTYAIDFTLKNRKCQNTAPPAYYLQIATSSVCTVSRNMWTVGNTDACLPRIQISAAPLTQCSLSSRPLQVHGGSCSNENSIATFTVKNVTQSSCLPGCNNTISIQVMVNLPLPAQACAAGTQQKIDIVFDPAAFVGCENDACIIAYNTLPYFTPSWKAGTLTLTVAQDIQACTMYRIDMTVTNNVARQQLSRTTLPTISAAGPVSISPVGMEVEGSDCRRPFEVLQPIFKVANIGQSSTISQKSQSQIRMHQPNQYSID
jgi:hypothetical protein